MSGALEVQSVGDRAEMQRVIGSWLEQKVGMVGRRGAATPSEHCIGLFVQGNRAPNAQIRPCNESVTHPGVYHPSRQNATGIGSSTFTVAPRGKKQKVDRWVTSV